MRQASIVYAIQAGGGPVKIGTTLCIEARLKALQGANHEPLRVVRTVPGTRVLERELHARFRADRIHLQGCKKPELTLCKCPEWFYPTEGVLRFAFGQTPGPTEETEVEIREPDHPHDARSKLLPRLLPRTPAPLSPWELRNKAMEDAPPWGAIYKYASAGPEPRLTVRVTQNLYVTHWDKPGFYVPDSSGPTSTKKALMEADGPEKRTAIWIIAACKNLGGNDDCRPPYTATGVYASVLNAFPEYRRLYHMRATTGLPNTGDDFRTAADLGSMTYWDVLDLALKWRAYVCKEYTVFDNEQAARASACEALNQLFARAG